MNKCNTICNPPNIRSFSYKAKNNHSKSSEKHNGRPLDLLGNDDNYANMFVFQPIMTAFVIIRLII